ncbi:MAG TPA: Gfo/Idh/MocA family oxidoreductase [Vicinamibacterales bacterium]|jgi:predicted dehydrogenase
MKFCMVGCGDHAVSSHGPALAAYAASHPAFELSGCCDSDRARAERFRERFGFGRSYGDWFEMLDAERPDAVALVVPVSLTCPIGSRILERGFPLLLEKPPGETVADVDRLAAAARAGGRDGRDVPHQVAFNRRHVPLVVALRARLAAIAGPLQHIRYEMVRVDRRDRDFSTTAIHAIDAVRFIMASDFASVRFRYREWPELGSGVANIFMDGVMTCGATAHLAFCPVAGVVVERADVHARDHTLFLEVPMWNGYDTPGRLTHLERGAVVEELRGPREGAGAAPFELGGFYDQYQAFFGALGAAQPPAPALAATRQSVEIAEAMRARRSDYQS